MRTSDRGKKGTKHENKYPKRLRWVNVLTYPLCPGVAGQMRLVYGDLLTRPGAPHVGHHRHQGRRHADPLVQSEH